MTRIERHKDSPDHTHTLRESDRLKRPEVIQSLVKEEAIKSYPPVAIVNAIKEHATDHLNLGACVEDLTRKEVTNIKYKVRGSMELDLIGDSKLGSDISQAVSYLQN